MDFMHLFKLRLFIGASFTDIVRLYFSRGKERDRITEVIVPAQIIYLKKMSCNETEGRGNEESVSCEELDLHSTVQVQGDNIDYNSLEMEREQLIGNLAEDVFELDVIIEEGPNSLSETSKVQKFSKEVAFASALIASSAGGLYSLMTGHLKMKNHTEEILYKIVIYFTFATFVSSVVLFFLVCFCPLVPNLDYLVKFTLWLSGSLFVCAIGFASMIELIVN